MEIERRGDDPGASSEAIKAHYDVSSSFYELWLDPTMTYSCGLWDGSSSLAEAQLRKLDFHIQRAKALGARRVLDVGCGWGSLLARLVTTARAESAVGLTLSDAQAEYVQKLQLPGVEVRVEGWRDHCPVEPYDAIISIGALEHFVRPETSPTERVDTYREFFRRCKTWLRNDGSLSLQTIAYGAGKFTHGAIAAIFPESDLPRLMELAAAAEGLAEIVNLQSDRLDYARTCRAWLERLQRNKHRAIEIVGEDLTRHYEAFLDASARGFDAGIFTLLRMQLRSF